MDCLDAKNKLAARQAALRREARLKLLRTRLRKAVQLHGSFFENHDTEWSLDEFLEVVRTTLALGAHAITDADVEMVFRELSDGDALHPDAVARFVNPEKPTTEKENAAPPSPAPDAPYTVADLSTRSSRRLHRKTRRRGRPRRARRLWRHVTSVAHSNLAHVHHVADPAAAPVAADARRDAAAAARAFSGRRADALLGARARAGRAAEALAASDTAAEDFPAELAVAFEQARRLRVRVAAAADGVATLAATIKRKRGAQPVAKSVSFSDDVVTP